MRTIRGHRSTQLGRCRPALVRTRAFDTPRGSDGGVSDEFVAKLLESHELNIGEACQRAMDAVLEEDWQVAGEAVMAANAFAEMRETMAAASSEEAATFAAKAAMEKRAAVIPAAERAVAAARQNAAEQLQYARDCRQEVNKLAHYVLGEKKKWKAARAEELEQEK